MSNDDARLSFQDKLATAGDAYITIPGAYAGIYGGGTFSDAVGPTVTVAMTTSSSVQSYGLPFRITVNSYNIESAKTLGFDLNYVMLPCGSLSTFQ